MLIPLSDIVVEDRSREGKGSEKGWNDFKNSFVLFGQLQAIKVEKRDDGKFKLLWGFRRFSAISELHAEKIEIRGLPPDHIEATIDDPAPVWLRFRQEFAENHEREDFTFVEKARHIRRFHEAMATASNDAWTQDMTARMLNLSPASISHYLRVEEAVRTDTSIAKASTLDAAVKRMKVHEKLKERKIEAQKESPEVLLKAESILTLGDARAWIKTIPDESIDFIDFDPPWGDDVAHKSQENHVSFDDSTEYANKLMDTLFPELFRVLKNDRFCSFWFRFWALEQMRAKAESFGFNLTHSKSPCVWYKPDKTTDQNRDPERRLIDAYETFYLLRKGDPVFHEKHVNNVFAFERVIRGSIIHPTEKPVELCRSILRLCTVPGETILIPCSGSSAMAEAGVRFSLKVKACELESAFYERGIARLVGVLK